VFSRNDSAYFGDPVFCQTAVSNIVLAFAFGNGNVIDSNNGSRT
jgi:hypothetical protein